MCLHVKELITNEKEFPIVHDCSASENRVSNQRVPFRRVMGVLNTI